MVFECQHTHVVSLTNPGAAELWAKHVVVPCLYHSTPCPAPTSLSAPKSWAPCLTLLLLVSLIDTVMCFHPPTSTQAHMNVQPVTHPRAVENGVVKSSAYLAEEAGWKRRFGGMAVKTEGVSEAHAKLWLRRLSLRGGGGPPPRPVWHWHYAAWPDHGVPASPEALLRLVGELAPVQTPILAHCSGEGGSEGV